jgi:hypothetical protein
MTFDDALLDAASEADPLGYQVGLLDGSSDLESTMSGGGEEFESRGPSWSILSLNVDRIGLLAVQTTGLSL